MYKTLCDLCNSNNYKELGPIAANKLVKCLSCGHIYMLYRPDIQELSEIYREDYFKNEYIKGNEKALTGYLEDKPNIIKFAEKRFAAIHKYKHPGKLLDIGCAMGFYLEYARNHGWDVHGLEISEYAADYARNLLKTDKIYNQPLELADFQKESFDAITMWLVLEHMASPLDALKKVNLWLKKDGILGVKVPNADGLTFRRDLPKWLSQHPADHMCDFTPDTLERLMHKAGFTLLEYETEGIYAERTGAAEELLKEEKVTVFYQELAQKCHLGDSMVMFFGKI